MANQQPFLQPLPPNYVPDILFRVDHNGRTGHGGFAGVPPSSNFDRNQNLVSRKSFTGQPLQQDFDNHLSWRWVNTPFLSFTSSWNRAARLREQKINQGYKDVKIVAIWAEDMTNVYSARTAAFHLGPTFRHAQNLDIFNNEYLVAWSVVADDYRILVNFDSSIFRPNQVQSIRNHVLNNANMDALQDILEQIYTHTGVWKFDVFNVLLCTIFDGPVRDNLFQCVDMVWGRAGYNMIRR